MSFFDSDIVQGEISEVISLQEKVGNLANTFPTMSKGDKVDHLDKLIDLIKKQQILYTRMKLSQDPEAQRIKDLILQSARELGFSQDVDLTYVFNKMLKVLSELKDNLDEYYDWGIIYVGFLIPKLKDTDQILLIRGNTNEFRSTQEAE